MNIFKIGRFIFYSNLKINIKFLLIISISYINNIIKIELKQNEDLNNLKDYYILNNNSILINKSNFSKNIKPKISIVCSVYNGENYILRLLRSIENQFFNEIEIIFIDDFSTDNSIKVIKELQKNDNRIILITLKRNKGTLFARNIGVLKSKGEFLIIPDVDDILSQNVLRLCYYVAKKNNFDLIRFNMYSDKEFVFNTINKDLQNPIYQPQLKNILIYGLGYKKLIDGILSNKFIKRTIYIKSLNNIKKYYLDKYMPYFEDGLINFSLHRNANSLYLLKRIGYFYIFNKNSISHSLNMNKYFTCYFIFLKFIFENIKNNEYEKGIVYFLLDEYIMANELLNKITKYSDIYEEVIDILLNSEYCDLNYKNKLLNMKKIILSIKYKE
jgi:glycosyltransferase involved in cell wall biosynthesis